MVQASRDLEVKPELSNASEAYHFARQSGVVRMIVSIVLMSGEV